MDKILNNVSLKTKLVIVYLIMVVLLIMLLGFYLSHRINNTSFYSSIELSNIASDQLKENFLNKMSANYKMVEAVKNNLHFNQYINTYYDDEYESLRYYIDNVGNIFSSLQYKDNSMEVRVYSNNDSIKMSKITNNSIEDLKRGNYFDVDEIGDLEINWTKPVFIDYGRDSKYIGCYKAFMEKRKDGLKAFLVFFFNEEELSSLFIKERENGKKIFIYNNKGEVITSTERIMLGKNIKELAIGDIDYTDTIKKSSLINYDGKNYLFIKNEISDERININHWGIISLVPADKMLADTEKIWISTFLICILFSVLSSVVILSISNNVTGRIANLLVNMENVKNGDFKVSERISGRDEIGVLEKDFYDMVNKIETLINEVYISKLELRNSQIKSQKIEMEKKEAEIIALQGQINPHYLFNTLETIRMNLLLNGDKKTADIILIFGESFRACFDNKSDFFTLAKEIDFINNYIQIQRYRYGDKINCVLNIPEHLLNYSIPKLILQPIVENAIYHGLEPKRGKGIIIIEAYEDHKDLFIKVTDDGVGIEPEDIKKLNDSIYGTGKLEESGCSGRIALRNVNKRLRLMYGDQYGLNIKSEKGSGTIVEINIKKVSDGSNFG